MLFHIWVEKMFFSRWNYIGINFAILFFVVVVICLFCLGLEIKTNFAYLHLMYTNQGFLDFLHSNHTPLTSVHYEYLKLAEGLKINDFSTKFPIFVHKKSAFLMREATVSKQQLSYFVLRLRTSRPKHTSCLYNGTHTQTHRSHTGRNPVLLKYEASASQQKLHPSSAQKGRIFVYNNQKFR